MPRARARNLINQGADIEIARRQFNATGNSRAIAVLNELINNIDMGRGTTIFPERPMPYEFRNEQLLEPPPIRLEWVPQEQARLPPFQLPPEQRSLEELLNDPVERRNLNAQNNSGATPLLLAVRSGSERNVQLFLRCPEINVNIPNHDRLTPLRIAVENRNADIMTQLLFNEHIDVNFKDNNEETPLHLAARLGYHDMVEILLQHPRMQVNLGDRNGETSLHLAVRFNHPHIVRTLLQHPQIDTNLPNQQGELPVELALEMGNEEIIGMF
ncbi:MAG: ankyrin repeat domain-containing protein [Puniceicoccales bacterium]|nr:ankyrin repeat domain-containing protein [Puniceicoccales bacterium]